MIKDIIKHWVRPEIQDLSAYHVPESGSLIKLDAMENPYRWPDELVDQWLSLLRDVELNRYPDPDASQLNEKLRTVYDIPPGMSTMLGNGSDELIQIIAMALSKPGRTILAPEPSFVMYRMIANFVGMEYVGTPLQDDSFALDMDAMRTAIDTHQPAIIFLAYPNNPTGNLFEEKQVCEIIETSPGLVVVDEAYSAFTNQSFMPMLGQYDNLLVMRTVSKIGLAGLRLGFLAGAPEWLHEFNKIRLPYNINILTQLSVQFAMENKYVLDKQTEQIRRDREKMYQAMQRIEGIQAYPSQANFILFRTQSGRAAEVFQGLHSEGVLIKNLNNAGGALSDCLRVTVGTAEENALFLQALKNSLV